MNTLLVQALGPTATEFETLRISRNNQDIEIQSEAGVVARVISPSSPIVTANGVIHLVDNVLVK